jgi:hypothetical protein
LPKASVASKRHVADVVIIENDAELERVGLDVCPSGKRVRRVAVGIQLGRTVSIEQRVDE